MAGYELNIQGLAELKKALGQLPKEISGKILADAVKFGAVIVRDAARAKVRKKLRRVERSIVVYRDRESTNNTAIYNVGVTMKKKYNYLGGVPRYASGRYFKRRYRYRGILGGKVEDVMWPAFWWRFLEFGTKKMGKFPFLVPAWQERQRAAAAEIVNLLGAGVEQAAAKVRW